MARFGSQEELAQFLNGLDAEYQQYAQKLWNEGGVRSVHMLANAGKDDLCQLGVHRIHASDIKARAAAAQAPVPPAGFLARWLPWFTWLSWLWGSGNRELASSVNNLALSMSVRLDNVQETMGALVQQLSWQDHSSVSSTFAHRLSQRMGIDLRTHVQLDTCCGFNLPLGPAPPQVPWDLPENNPIQVERCRQHLQEFVAPPGVTVRYAGNRKFLIASSTTKNFSLSGKTDMLFLAGTIPSHDAARELSDQEITLNIKKVIGMYEIKTDTAYDRNAVWPQAAVECLTFHQMTDRCIPTFAGDLNRNLVLHWASDGRELHVGQDDGLLSVATMRRLLEEGKRLYDQRNPADTNARPRQRSDGGAVAQEEAAADPGGVPRRNSAVQRQQLLLQRRSAGAVGGQQRGHPVAAPDDLVAVMSRRFPTLLSPSKLQEMDAVWEDSTRLVGEMCPDSEDLAALRSIKGSEWAASFVARMAALSEQAGQAEQAT